MASMWKGTQGHLARAVGYSQQHLSDVLCGRADVSEKFVAKLCAILGGSLPYIMYGVEPEAEEPSVNEGYGQFRVPVVTLAAANPLSTIAWEPFDPPEWLTVPRGCQAIEVRGDSMAPVILDGQRPIFDPKQAPGDGDLAFVVMLDGRHLIKRWWKQGKGGILLESFGARDTRMPKRPDPDLVVREKDIRHAYKIIMIDLRGGKQ